MSANLDALERVAKRLGVLRKEVVFVGGAVTELLITEEGAPAPRMTADIDAIAEVTTTAEYYGFLERLRALGFVEDRSEDAPMCRWLMDGVKVDLMPPDAGILGFSNRWYPETIATATTVRLPHGTEVRVAGAACFLATKLEAFAGRGKGDFATSHDMEDLIAVVDGRPEVPEDVRSSPPSIRAFLCRRIGEFLETDAFLECVTGHLPSDEASQQRVGIVFDRLKAIVASSSS